MSATRAHRAPYVALLVVQVLFASNAIIGRIVLATVPAGILVGCRVVGAAMGLALVNLIRGGPWIRDPDRHGHLL